MILLVFVYHSIGPGWPSRSELGNQEQFSGKFNLSLRAKASIS
jgi:hypothetical protein